MLGFIIDGPVLLEVDSQNPILWGVSLSFQYSGPQEVSAEVTLYDSSCSSELPLVDHSLKPSAVVFTTGGFEVDISVNTTAAQESLYGIWVSTNTELKVEVS